MPRVVDSLPKSGEPGAIGRRMFGSVINPPSTSTQEDENDLPPVGELVLVQCDHYRCLAFRDKHGKWRSPFSKMELSGVVSVIKADCN
jgi:hypothetical protein